MAMRSPVLVLNANTQRETGRKAQIANIQAGKAIADIICTTLGPRAMLKMILDPMGGITLTSDGNAILREIDVTHPAAKSIIDISRTQDEECGDGTTSVIVLAGEMLNVAEPYIEKNVHPTIIVQSYFRALDDAIDFIDKNLTFPIDVNDTQELKKVVEACIGTKFTRRYNDLLTKMAIEAVKTVQIDNHGKKEIDIKRFAKVEKLPGGDINDSRVLKGVMLNKDITHPKMRRYIENPRVILLDCPLEYKKGESMTNVEVQKEADWETLLKLEEEQIKTMCNEIIRFKPDLVFTEKGVSDLAQHYLLQANITVLRRLRKTDNNRIARVTGATIVHRTSEIQESDVGTDCGLFEIKKIGDEYFTFLDKCKNPKACTIILRGASKDVLNEIERNLQDAMGVVRNVLFDPRLVPGGGAVEMSVSQYLMEKSKTIEGVHQWPYQAVAIALEVIPRTLASNCGANTIRLLTELRAKHSKNQNLTWGVDGVKGQLADMKALGIIEPFTVKTQTIKSSIEAASMLLRIDAIVSGVAKKKGGQSGGGAVEGSDDQTFGDARDG